MPSQPTLAALHIITDEKASVASITPNKYNPNRQSDDEFLMLCKSIVEDGFTDAVIVNTDRSIIDGEHRWTAAIVLHYLAKTGQPVTLSTTKMARAKRAEIIDPELMIPVKVLDKDEVQRRISTQRHNKARGHDDIELAAAMFRELEALGGLTAAMEGLDMTNEEAERLLAYGDSILDHFPGDAPSLAWEPRQTQPGQVQSWSDPDTNQAQSVSRAAATPAPVAAPVAGAVTTAHSLTPEVPGLAMARSQSAGVVERQPVMARRIYVMLEEEAKLVDRALGAEAATALVAMCKEKLGL